MLGNLLTTVGLLILIHSTISAIQYRRYLRGIGEHFTSLPIDIVLEVLVAFALSAWGSVLISGTFRPIKVTSSLSKFTTDMLNSRPDFMLFNHRGRGIESSSRTSSKEEKKSK